MCPWRGGAPRGLIRFLLAAILSLTLLPPPPALALSDAQQLVVEAWKLVNQSYVDPARLDTIGWRRRRQKTLERPIRRSTEAYDAVEAMLAAIGDPYTKMLRPEDFGTLRSTAKGKVSGVGLQLGLDEDGSSIVVIAPLDDSPASEAGIASGSAVLRVDGRDSASLGLERTAEALRGPVGTDVQVRLRSPDGRERELRLERRTVDLHPVRWRQLSAGGHRLGYLRITQFSEPVPVLVRQALAEFRSPPGVEGLLLDLRNNSGGLVSAGVAVADMLLDGQPIVSTEDRSGITAPQQAARGSLYPGPLLTLVNGGTASASEILAGALQDNGRATLAGSRTFGKGLIQTLIPLGDGSGLAVTVARYLTPEGHDIQGRGIEPDRLLPTPEPLTPGGAEDTWMSLAAERLGAELEGRAGDGGEG